MSYYSPRQGVLIEWYREEDEYQPSNSEVSQGSFYDDIKFQRSNLAKKKGGRCEGRIMMLNL